MAHQIHESVLLSDPARPHVRAEVPDLLGLSDSLEGVSGHGLHEIRHLEGNAAVGIDAETQIFPELVLGTS